MMHSTASGLVLTGQTDLTVKGQSGGSLKQCHVWKAKEGFRQGHYLAEVASNRGLPQI